MTNSCKREDEMLIGHEAENIRESKYKRMRGRQAIIFERLRDRDAKMRGKYSEILIKLLGFIQEQGSV